MLSDGFSEGQAWYINKGFPTDTLPYTESYDYLSDSDLEDDESEELRDDDNSDSEVLAKASKNPQLGPQAAGDIESHHTSVPNLLNRLTPRVTYTAGPLTVSKGQEKLSSSATLQQ